MLHARPRAHAPDGTSFSASRQKLHRRAIAVSVIIVFVLASAAAVATYDEGHLLPRVDGADDRRNLILMRLARGVTSGKIRLAVGKRFGKSATSRKTATAAVSARKQAFDLDHLFIPLDFKLSAKEGKHHGKDRRNGDQYRSGYENGNVQFCQQNEFHLPPSLYDAEHSGECAESHTEQRRRDKRDREAAERLRHVFGHDPLTHARQEHDRKGETNARKYAV